MRLLKAEYLSRICGCSLQDVVCCNVGDMGLESFCEAFSSCGRMEALRARNNKLKAVEGLSECRSLWVIDLSNNQITSLQGLTSFKGLGHLNLCGNKLRYEDLRCLENVHILELELGTGNPELLKGVSKAVYRQKVIKMLPLLWVLDGQFISVEEATLARELPNSGEDVLEPSVSLWKGAASWEGIQTNGDFAMELLAIASEAPSKPKLVDRYKLKQLSQMYTRQCFRDREYAHRMPGFYTRSAGGSANTSTATLQNGPRPHLHTEDLTLLSPRQILDFCIMLSSLIHFPGMISPQIVEESLSVLVSNQLNAILLHDLARLPPFACTINAFFLHELLRNEFQGYSKTAGTSGMSSFDQDLWKSIPRVCTRYSKAPLLREEMDTVSTLRFRHSVILFSRSPNFPPLLKSQRSPQMEARFIKLSPLLEIAGMGENDLEPGGQHYSHRETLYQDAEIYTQTPIDGDPAFEDQVGGQLENCVESEASIHGNIEIGADVEDVGGLNEDTSMMDSIVNEHGIVKDGHGGYTMQSDNADQGYGYELAEVSAVHNQTFHAGNSHETFAGYSGLRKPRGGELVEVEANIFTRVAEVDTENPSQCVITLRPFKGFEKDPLYGNLRISSSDLFLGSNNAWRYVHGFRQGTNRGISKPPLLRNVKLHRTNKNLNRTGLQNNTGVLNGDIFVKKEMKGTVQSVQRTPACVDIFTVNQTWNSNFVIAPQEMIDAQNAFAKHSGQIGNTAHQGWSPLYAPSYVVKENDIAMNVERPKPLAPQKSAVRKILQKHINQSWKQEHKLKARRAQPKISVSSPQNAVDTQHLRQDIPMETTSTKSDSHFGAGMKGRAQSQPLLESILKVDKQRNESGKVHNSNVSLSENGQRVRMLPSRSTQSLPATTLSSIYTTDESLLSKEDAWLKLQKEMGSFSNAVTGNTSRPHVRVKLPTTSDEQSPTGARSGVLNSLAIEDLRTNGVSLNSPNFMSHRRSSRGNLHELDVDLPRSKTLPSNVNAEHTVVDATNSLHNLQNEAAPLFSVASREERAKSPDEEFKAFFLQTFKQYGSTDCKGNLDSLQPSNQESAGGEAVSGHQKDDTNDGFFNMTAIDSGVNAGIASVDPESDERTIVNSNELNDLQDDSLLTLQNEMEIMKKTKQPKQKVSYKVWYCVPAKPQFIVQEDKGTVLSKIGRVRTGIPHERPRTPVVNLSFPENEN